MVRVWYKDYGQNQVVLNCDCGVDRPGFMEITDLSGFGGEEALAYSGNTTVYEDGTYNYVSEYDLTDAKELKQSLLKDECDRAASVLISKYSQVEQQSWPIQLEEAEAWSVDKTVSTPFLDSILASCSGTGVTKEGLVATIIQNNAAWQAACASLVGQRIAKQDSITACTTRIQLESLDLSINVGV